MKLIEKLLDKYYTIKLMKLIYNDLSLFFISKKIEYKNNEANLYIKKVNEKDEYYKLMYKAYYENSIYILCDQKYYNGLIEELKENIYEYIRRDK